MSPLICQSNGKKVANSSNIKERSALQFLRNKGDMLQQLSDLLDLAKGQFNIGGKESSFYERVSYLSSYYDALKFLCQPIAECIHSERTEIFAETEGASYWTNLGTIQDAFQQLCYIFLTYQRYCIFMLHYVLTLSLSLKVYLVAFAHNPLSLSQSEVDMINR